MNIILFTNDEVKQATITVTDQRAQHIIKVIKAKAGDTLITGEINGAKGTSQVQEIDRHSVIFTNICHTITGHRPQVDLIMALPRPIMLRRVLAQVATFGANHLFLVNSNRVEKSFFSSASLRPEKMERNLLDGLEQASATALPTVSIHKRFRPFVEDELPGHLPSYDHLGVAHPCVVNRINDIIPPGTTGHTLLAIGPEGGWVDYEVNRFKDLGITPFGMGERILRVDSVVPALLSQVNLLRTMSLKTVPNFTT